MRRRARDVYFSDGDDHAFLGGMEGEADNG